MYFYSTMSEGLTNILDRLCGSTLTTYSYKSKCSDLNDALDWYLQLAFKADGQWTFDDLGETSPPIDTQNIVSGTNRYKFSSFAEKIIKLIKLEILDEDGQGLELIPETFDDLGTSFQERYLDTANTGTPTHYCKYGDFIYLYPFPDYSETSGLKVYFNRPLTKFEFVSCQPEADDELITATAHGLTTNDTVLFEVDSAGTISGGITADLQHWVIASGLTANVFKVSLTKSGSSINITSDGTNVYFLKLNAEPPISIIHHTMLARKAASIYMGFNNTNGVYNSRLQLVLADLAKDEQKITDFFSSRGKDIKPILSPVYLNNE